MAAEPRSRTPVGISRFCRGWFPCALLALLGALPCAARAQQFCDGGRVASDTTAGQCCWPGQRWSHDRALCEGPPRCPEGLGARGEDCVAAEAGAEQRGALAPAERPAGPAPVVASHADPIVAGWPPAEDLVRPASVRWERVRVSDDGLLAAGLVVLGTGYLMGILSGVFTELECTYYCDGRPTYLAPIPIAGGIVGGMGSVWWGAFGIPAAVLQIVGVTMMGFAIGRYELEPEGELGDARLFLVPHADLESVGVTLGLEI